MRIMVTIEDELYAKVLELVDPKMDKADLFHEALESFVSLRIAQRLAALGSAAPEVQAPRQRSEPAE